MKSWTLFWTFLLAILPYRCSYRLFTTKWQWKHSSCVYSGVQTIPLIQKDTSSNILVPIQENGTNSLVHLVQIGSEWMNDSPLKGMTVNDVDNSFLTVPGCIANVKLKASVSNSRVRVLGLADSRVALGMLALISKVAEDMPVQEILRVSSQEFATSFEIDKYLPKGRLDGFQNIWKTLQNSILQSSGQVGDNLVFQTNRSEEIAVLLSGGVDSSVALALLASQGLKVRAYYLKIWLEDELAHLNECPWEEDLKYAREVCQQLQVPLEVISLQLEYWNYVVNYTLTEARAGRTPNPDIMCNSFVKFGAFRNYVGQYHTKIASGHYARLLASPWQNHSLADKLLKLGFSLDLKQTIYLGRSPDPIKDQSYFLSNLKVSQLEQCLFPIGEYWKLEIRQLAQKFELITQSRKDSQGICFLGKLKFDDFLKHYLGELPGKILYSLPSDSTKVRILPEGQVIGQHHGLWFHTIGQRKGIGQLLSPNVLHHGPFYVVQKNVRENTLTVTNDWEAVDQPRRICYLSNINWLLRPPSVVNSSLSTVPVDVETISYGIDSSHYCKSEDFLLDVKLRHGPSLLPARVAWIFEKDSPDQISFIRIELLERDKGIAAGQIAVLYLEEYCLASGTIL